jgi:hypothetical protein
VGGRLTGFHASNKHLLVFYASAAGKPDAFDEPLALVIDQHFSSIFKRALV